MTSWSTIRKATDEDMERLQAAAERFCKRHQIERRDGMSAIAAVEYATMVYPGEEYTHVQETKRLARLWTAAIRRALRHPSCDGIAWGYVGYSVK